MACPRGGLGGGLTSHGRPIEWFSSRLVGSGEHAHRASVRDAADSEFSPDSLQHIPGGANVTADALSRRWGPGQRVTGGAWLSPLWLPQLPETFVPVRNRDFYRTLRWEAAAQGTPGEPGG